MNSSRMGMQYLLLMVSSTLAKALPLAVAKRRREHNVLGLNNVPITTNPGTNAMFILPALLSTRGVPMSQASDSDQLTLPVTGRDHTQGSLDAPVVLVEYGDYQCPQCGQAHSTVKEIQQRLGDQLCFVFRHFPLIKLHSQAQKAAKVAEVAAIQDKFWQMHNILFEHQHALDDAALVQYAIDIKLDITRFLRDMAEHIYVKRVQEGINSGISSSVSSTPSFFINGVRHEGTWDRESLLAVIGEVGNAQDY